jgi:hypothetical protein
MKFIQRLFSASKPPAFEASRMQPQLAPAVSQQFPLSQNGTRRELLQVVLRDTLHRQGIPSTWLAGEPLTTTARDNTRGLHWRLVIKHWDERLVVHSVALQQALTKRVMTFDPMASTWLHGISWQYGLEDESVCPPLPHPGSWTARAPAESGSAADDSPLQISGVDVAAEADNAKPDLDALLAVRDADFKKHSPGEGGGWTSTEPAKL